MAERNLAKLISVAKGEYPADLLILNAKVVNVFNGEIEEGNIAIAGEYIAGVGDYTEGKDVADVRGKYVLPGYINAHVHIESSMLDVAEYVTTVVTRGTLGLVTDLHELSNVLGIEAFNYVIEMCNKLPLDFYLMAPSCVPATTLETSGASIDVSALEEIMKKPGVIGLGEMMNYPGVLKKDPAILNKLKMFQDFLIDGHAPGLGGRDLSAYISSGIYSDHECISADEAREKLAKGMYIMMREGSSEKNLEALLPLVNDKNYHRCMLVTDDRNAVDLNTEGDMDWAVYRAVSLGIDPVRAIQMATINPAQYLGAKKVGAIAPGYFANMITVSDLKTMDTEEVFYRGYLVGVNKMPNFTPQVPRISQPVDTIHIKDFEVEDLALKLTGDEVPVINIVPGQIVTKKTMEKPKIENDSVVADTSRDILKIAVVERHKASGNIGIGLIKGFGLKKGAVASSVAHDSHNIIAIGTNDQDLAAAIKEVELMQGGLVMVLNGEAIGRMELPIAGLLSLDTGEAAAGQLHDLEILLKVMGVNVESPFTVLSFMALPVIPEIRITDKGVIDVNKFEVIA
ncbi:MAG: adenine deaminase [Dehalococcoidales bacterium]|jgi:adenine deaminase|nr:adenine deaminase [Dehalococcoidales bacterium]MDD3264321.1 adenine deaminase [Dehalococcoidales bacterium]MDD4322058.1 adenine deaminase [Dehalococcoidales bacterium]MDD4793629.1 adenine deaminase [Dehalococcoidales bacterium]MDD5122004.1 adenine deaminase [Dehalococcoidales bacterium]